VPLFPYMLIYEFDYSLPPDLIAQEPPVRRGESRLLHLIRATGAIAETTFPVITDLLRPGDLLVLNETRVIPARLSGRKETGGQVEVFLVRRLVSAGETWECLIRASKPARSGTVILLPNGVTGRVVERSGTEKSLVSFTPEEGFEDWLETAGSLPLPPYIKRPAGTDDRERYQTVFARVKGAVAAPTAGLHVTPELLQTLAAKGVTTAAITLHVGLGTFLPIRVDRVEDHRMHREHFSIPEATALAINQTRQNGGRVIALGTTVCRTLEHAATENGTVAAGDGEADIFIYPGYQFKITDGLITNFHLPKSTLLMLVSAFAGKELLFLAYEEAIRRRFRFFSYGDAMFIE
jgi:S-adenosylmethionine:tRNA ribosyltransferase-isomerase